MSKPFLVGIVFLQLLALYLIADTAVAGMQYPSYGVDAALLIPFIVAVLLLLRLDTWSLYRLQTNLGAVTAISALYYTLPVYLSLLHSRINDVLLPLLYMNIVGLYVYAVLLVLDAAFTRNRNIRGGKGV